MMSPKILKIGFSLAISNLKTLVKFLTMTTVEYIFGSITVIYWTISCQW